MEARPPPFGGRAGVCPAHDPVRWCWPGKSRSKGKGRIPVKPRLADGGSAQVTPFGPVVSLGTVPCLAPERPEVLPRVERAVRPSLAQTAAFQPSPEAGPPPGPCPCGALCQKHSLVRVLSSSQPALQSETSLLAESVPPLLPPPALQLEAPAAPCPLPLSHSG